MNKIQLRVVLIRVDWNKISRSMFATPYKKNYVLRLNEYNIYNCVEATMQMQHCYQSNGRQLNFTSLLVSSVLSLLRILSVFKTKILDREFLRFSTDYDFV